MLRRFILAATVLVLAAPASAMPTPSSAPPEPVTPPAVPAISQPISSLMALITWPEVAGKKVGGVAKVQCEVTPDGKTTDCAILFECPVGHGFGEATLKAAATFKVKSRAAGRTVIIPIVWKLEDGGPPSAECLSRSQSQSGAPTLLKAFPVPNRF